MIEAKKIGSKPRQQNRVVSSHDLNFSDQQHFHETIESYQKTLETNHALNDGEPFSLSGDNSYSCRLSSDKAKEKVKIEFMLLKREPHVFAESSPFLKYEAGAITKTRLNIPLEHLSNQTQPFEIGEFKAFGVGWKVRHKNDVFGTSYVSLEMETGDNGALQHAQPTFDVLLSYHLAPGIRSVPMRNLKESIYFGEGLKHSFRIMNGAKREKSGFSC